MLFTKKREKGCAQCKKTIFFTWTHFKITPFRAVIIILWNCDIFAQGYPSQYLLLAHSYTRVSQPGDRGGVLSEGQTLSSNDEPALMCVCVCARIVCSVCVSLRENTKRNRESQVLFLFIYFFYRRTLFFFSFFFFPSGGPFVCMCVQVFYVRGRACVCVAHCVMRCLYDKHKASLRGILIRGFATVVMETALSTCVSQCR